MSAYNKLIGDMSFGLSDKEKRNLRFTWNAAIDEAVKTSDKNFHIKFKDEFLELIKKLKEGKP